MTPRWRWRLFCAALWLHFELPDGWMKRAAGEVLSWSVLPAWVWDGEAWPQDTGAAPF